MLTAGRERDTAMPQDLEDAVMRFKKLTALYKIYLRSRQSPHTYVIKNRESESQRSKLSLHFTHIY